MAEQPDRAPPAGPTLDASGEADLLRLLRRMPKVELHLHLEGSFTPARIAELAAAAGEQLPCHPSQIFAMDSLETLLSRLDWWCGLVRSADDAARQAYDLAKRLSEDGVAYAEVIVNPTHWRGLPRPVLLEAVSAGFSRASASGLCDCWLLVSLLRHQTAEEAMGLVEEITEVPPPRLVGLSIDGNEATAGPTGRRFAAAFARAGAHGLGLTAHAGESSGPEGVWSALDDLGVSRVDHGIRAVEDRRLLRRLVADQVTLNVCITSNLTLLYRDLDSHPVRRLVGAGVPVTVNTDDPVPLDITLTGEMALATRHLGWGLKGAIDATQRAVDASFAAPVVAGRLLRRLDDFRREHADPPPGPGAQGLTGGTAPSAKRPAARRHA
ncbi:MAG TPA: adenosine deaminase [Acidimicrobiales bacterium]|nr:adenosine deaminase [Acidimicrobiales bacterium]